MILRLKSVSKVKFSFKSINTGMYRFIFYYYYYHYYYYTTAILLLKLNEVHLKQCHYQKSIYSCVKICQHQPICCPSGRRPSLQLGERRHYIHIPSVLSRVGDETEQKNRKRWPAGDSPRIGSVPKLIKIRS